MLFVYLDESGDPSSRPKSKTSFYVVSALVVRAEDVRVLEDKASEVQHYLASMGIKLPREEFKGATIWRELFKALGKDKEKAVKVMSRIYDLLTTSDKYKLVTVAIDKDAYVSKTPLREVLENVQSSINDAVDGIKSYVL